MIENDFYSNKPKRKLTCILLIDDDESTNVLHQLVLEEADIAENTLFFSDPQEALNYLNLCNKPFEEDGMNPVPDLIFLDLNMPLMSGFDFMRAYAQLDFYQQFKPILIVLSTSLQMENYQDDKPFKGVNAMRTKPLTLELLDEIIDEFFDGDQ